jgi:transposase
MILLAAERGMVAAEIAAIVRQDEETVRRWFARYLAEGIEGLSDAPRSGAPPKATSEYRERLLQVARCRPRALGLPFELLEALLAKHPRGTVYVAWDNAGTHEDDEVEAVLRGAAGRLVLLYLPTYSPWLNPAEMLWRQYRREVTHCELFESIDALLEATREFFDRCNRTPRRTLSIIGAHPA